MDLEYDQKFEEMKMYIPFLESMIKRLETTNSGVKNPRKAQLDKIRSLRDLLLDKKKRMKMENLLKCEQVLVNLYAKVEQRDSMVKEDCSEQNQKDKSDLNVVRHKLKSVVSKFQEEIPETLPEIARATNTEVVCTPGSKEPALFQRRPNKVSPNQQSHSSRNDDNTSSSKRQYTRVLMSPDRKKKEWSANSNTSTEKPLFSRRSPRRSPRRYSPSYKKERKKTSRQRSKSSQNSKDLNITLKVPEETLGSLNTKDILSRIINCSDNDVDIDTLRGLRSQILGELKQTGSKDDISDLILKSYKKKDTVSTKKDEVEEGELSDSESEAIQNIYGSLVVVNEDADNTNTNKVSSDKKHPRKIQICLVINSDKDKDNKINAQKLSATLDVSDFEAYEEKKTQSTSEKVEDKIDEEITGKEITAKEIHKPEAEIETKCVHKELEEEPKSPQKTKTESNQSSNEKNQKVSEMSRTSTETFQPNFYKPFMEDKAKSENTPENQNSCKSSNTDIDCNKEETSGKPTEVVKNFQSRDTSANIHIEKVSEIDILQALKKEILGETPTVSMSETITPPLHQPKITKVASALEIAPKKRISIEKYKQKSVPSVKQPLFNSTKQNSVSKDDNSKKQSLKLTEKECERFNFPVDVSPVDSSDDDDKLSSDEFPQANSVRKSSDDMNKSTLDFEFLGNSIPKSPDHEDFADTGIKPPVIIPSDPVKYVVASTKVDVDMRTIIPLLSPDGSWKSTSSPSITSEKEIEAKRNEKSIEKIRNLISEPRAKTELNQHMASDSPRASVSYQNITPSMSPTIASNIPALMSLNVSYTTPNLSTNIVSSMTSVITPILNSNIPLLMNPNMTPSMLSNMNPVLAASVIPNMNPSMTPSRMVPSMNPMMTPIHTPNARSYEMTPRPNFDHDDYSNQKHVYAPIFPTFEPHDFSEKDTLNMQLNHRETKETLKWEDRNPRCTSVQRDIDYHVNRTDRYKGDKSLDSPKTRMECPSTPNAAFGRMECPPTPMPSFGRVETPMTPSHSFGRSDCPMTPSHSFGRSDCPMTPSHSFGRSDPNMTPTNVFGRGDYHDSTFSFSYKYTKSQDPRLNRSSDYDKYQGRSEERRRSHFEDDRSMTENTYKYRRSQVKSYGQVSRNSRDRMSSHRESSVGRSLPKDYDTDDSYSKDSQQRYNSDSRYRREKYKYIDGVNKRRDYNAESIERMNPLENTVSMRERGRMYRRRDSIEKPISVQSHTGRSFNIDTSFNRTFQETELSSLNTSFDDRRRRASSVGRSLRDSPRKDLKRSSTNNHKFELNVTDHKSMQFRRACSVGRDLKDYNADKNFDDIKEDLRSYKFNNYDFKLRDQGHNNKKQNNYKNEKVISNELQSSSRDMRVAYPTSTMSTEHQINRDPRKTTQNSHQYINKFHNDVKYSPRNNYRDPRMRREIDGRTPKKDKYNDRNPSSSRFKNYGIVYSNDNIAKGMILASAGGVKNFKIPKIKRPAEEKEVEYNTKPSESDAKKEVPFKNSNKEDNVNIEHCKKGESKQTRPVISSVEKRRNLQNDNENAATVVSSSHTVVNKSKYLENSIKMADKIKSQENSDSANFTIDNGDRRVTRSVNKVGTPSKLISITSPIRKLRRIKRLIYDSDSDSQEADSYTTNIKKNIEESKNKQTMEDKEEHKNDFAIANEENIEKSFNMQEQPDNSKHMESKNCVYENDINIEETNDINALAINEKLALPQKELCEEQNNSLDISFGVDDELSSDNIASESVLDNINALIAGLDHDIETPKINDFNDKFINNIVGNISSNGSVSFNASKTDFSADVILNDKTEFVQESAIHTSSQVPLAGDNTDAIEDTHIKNNSLHVNDLIQSSEKSDTQNESKEIKNNDAIESATLTTSNTDKTFVQENTIKSIYEVQEVMKNLDTDAVVSTTANDGKTDENSVSQTSSVNITISDKGLAETESSPDSTNDLTSELNNDVTSTHNSHDMSSKEQCSTNSVCAENIPRIDSIGKLLSILEDKKKIKELLTMLGKNSGENQKIKKKLEKLSEIVSDDEEIAGEGDKDTNELSALKSNNEKETSDDNNKSVIETGDREESDKEKSIVARTMQCYDGPLCKKDSAANNDINKMDDDQCKNVKEQEIFDIILAGHNTLSCTKLLDNDSIENINKDVNETGDDIKRVNEKEEAKNLDVEDNPIEEIIEEASTTNEKENQDSILEPTLTKTGKKKTKSKITKRGRSRLAKKLSLNKEKRVTGSEAGSSQSQIPSVPKKPSRELLKLQEDIRDMFIREDILNATGIRMCRLAKLVNKKNVKGDAQTTEVENAEPIVVLENISSKMSSDESFSSIEKINKKRGPKSKVNAPNQESDSKGKLKYKPGPKFKTKSQEHDPYFFETDSIDDPNTTVDSRDQHTDSDSDSVSTKSFGSLDVLAELKKKTKRKRPSWQIGVIKKKGIKNKTVVKRTESSIPTSGELGVNERKEKMLQEIPDLNCFTDKSYCFNKNVKSYLCRLCGYKGNDIVPHYKKHHPHSEIPLSRLNPETAKAAIEQCENFNLQAIIKIQTMKYVCRFCFQEFHKPTTALETFFWHVVSVHTGEYKQICSECINVTRCPLHLDIPPPPKNLKGQLIGYICGRCNFTQVSLENLKTHVIIRHDDEQTEVYPINLGEISRKALQTLITKASESLFETPRMLRSARSLHSHQSVTEPSDDCSDNTDVTDRIAGLEKARDKLIKETDRSASPKIATGNKIQSKLIFESDDFSDTSSYSKNDEIIQASVKLERDEDTQDSLTNPIDDTEQALEPESEPDQPLIDYDKSANNQTESRPSSDVLDYPHFKVKLSETGTKEYVCCINGKDNHYKTTLLISFKKHVQLKHPENWDGYCFICKVIVTGQGKHMFKDCLQHFLDKHIDNFPVLDETLAPTVNDVSQPATSTPVKDMSIPKSYINVRPLSELISSEQSKTQEVNPLIPKIQNVMSLGSPTDPSNSEPQKEKESCNYEEAQAEVMRQKHRVVLEAMLSHEKLIQVFKCSGRYCSYTTNNAEEALLHASTHQKIGGVNSLKCVYCDFDSSGNAIDLVMHVFKNYSHCSYACSKCFYRAAGSQLVYAHVKRVHSESDADKVPVLRPATLEKDTITDDFLSREGAVLYYVCNNRDPDDGSACQFKSYVVTKFREHLHTKHANDAEYSCNMCNITTSSTRLLTQHLKSHGMKIYQCSRCLFGADNETEMIAHASEKHPFRQPKAYLRIITSKGGSSDARVLPLAVLSKKSIEPTVVTSSPDKESPVKQAERSIDLEKLIGHTNLIIESMSTITNAVDIEPVDVTVNEGEIQVQSEQASCSPTGAEPGRTSPAILTLLKDPQTTVNTESSVVKSDTANKRSAVDNHGTTKPETDQEIPEVSPIAPLPAASDTDVVCLDSDEDNSRQNFIDLSSDDTPVDSNITKTQQNDTDMDIKIPRSRLYLCSKCNALSKSEGMFKRHIISCCPNPKEQLKCAYCSHVTSANIIVNHYNNSHLENFTPFICALCKGKFVTLVFARKHLKHIHNVITITVTTKTSANGMVQYIVDSDTKERQAPKRKFSGENSNKTSEPAHKLKKYGPQDIDKLPINPILDNLVYCSLCEFNTKVRLNMVRHLQMHAEQQPVSQTAPVNPVPHLESNEKHFDRMLNLASSSIITSNKSTKDGSAPEALLIYPKYVSDRVRYTCGAKDCSYISVKESMLRIHWETLHAGTDDFHCVHCATRQPDKNKPMTVARIITHLKMHDSKLYACSSCRYYHYTRKAIEKHLKEVHSRETGKVKIIREDGAALPPPTPAPTQSFTAPTMDLKPWQCGLCQYKSMLCPEVIEHCGKFHQSKMQFKCTYCGFRTSHIENISKHQSKQHPGKKEEVFYFYYREGSIPDDADGTTRWQKQSQKDCPEIKVETGIPPPGLEPTLPKPASPNPPNLVNLDIVKKEVVETATHVHGKEDIEELCTEFGQFCEPNGLRYKCSLCKGVMEDTKEAMQSHLYEELQYRKWGCGVCSYKAFHKPGLQQHVQTEHRNNREARDPVELEIDPRIETWVAKLLDHQTAIIERNKENLAKQKAEILRANPGGGVKVEEKPAEPPQGCEAPTVTMAGLEKLFGPFGVPTNMNYTCPKCNTSTRTENVMQKHLEHELNKIRWFCNNCNETFQNYHDAQFHCRSVHPGVSCRPMEVTRNIGLRAAWVAAALRVQKLSMNYKPVSETHVDTPAQPSDNSPENSLLVVRYEEKVPTPEEQMLRNNKSTDDDKVNADEPEKKKNQDVYLCSYCPATYKYENFFQCHVLKHYGLKPYTCPYCPHNDTKKAMELHITSEHPNRSVAYLTTPIPKNPPIQDVMAQQSTSKPAVVEIESKIICLGCEESMTKAQSQSHLHDNVRPQFAMKGNTVYRCSICLTLHKTSTDFNLHHKQFHGNEKKNTFFYKLDEENRSLYCSLCKRYFSTITQYRTHHQTSHGWRVLDGPLEPSEVIEIDDELEAGGKRKAEGTTILPVAKRVAKKSTTKLPRVMAVAKKSTTKLPFNAPCDDEEYSYYGARPSTDNLENVTTLMPFCNTYVPFTLKKLNEIIKMYPVVVLKDINDKK